MEDDWCDEGDNGKMGWIWRKGMTVGKKLLAAGFVLSSAPFVVPPLVVASTIALISSVPYCFFLASYACTQNLMKTLLPATPFDGGAEENNKLGHMEINDVYDDEPFVAINELIEGTGATALREEDRTPSTVTNIVVVDVYQSPDALEDEDMKKVSNPMIESLRGEGRSKESLDRGISKKASEEEEESIVWSDGRSEKVGGGGGGGGEGGVKDVSGEVESSTSTSERKDVETSSKEVEPEEEQIWEKMEALRKIVGYSVTRSTTYLDELKALYMFMGLELPSSMLDKENHNIAQVTERLCFLMSVIGIK